MANSILVIFRYYGSIWSGPYVKGGGWYGWSGLCVKEVRFFLVGSEGDGMILVLSRARVNGCAELYYRSLEVLGKRYLRIPVLLDLLCLLMVLFFEGKNFFEVDYKYNLNLYRPLKEKKPQVE